MASHSISTDPEIAAELHAQDALFYREILHALIEMGCECARMVHAQAKAHVEGAPETHGVRPMALTDAATAFDRVSRCVRRCIVLAMKVAETGHKVHPAQTRIAARKSIIRGVEDAIHRDAKPHEADDLRAELEERLDAPEFEDDIEHRPISEIIDEICRDLGVAGQIGLNFWKRRTPDDVARLCAYAARPYGAAGDAVALPEIPAGADEILPLGTPNDGAALLARMIRWPRDGSDPAGPLPGKPGRRRSH